MITASQKHAAVAFALTMYEKAHITITPSEAQTLEVADFGLGNLEEIGLALLIYINTPRVCAKEMVLSPRQTCPEHLHPDIDGAPGKEETFRCRYGTCNLFIYDPVMSIPSPLAPPSRKEYFTAFRCITLQPGEQYTLQPGTLHWFTAGDEGAVISEFSTMSRDAYDIFTDPDITRETIVTQ